MPRRYEPKGEHPLDRACREFLEASDSLSDTDVLPHKEHENAPELTPRRLRWVLNHLIACEAPYAYSLVLQVWLSAHGVKTPDGLFCFDPLRPGSGRTRDEEKVDLGFEALALQVAETQRAHEGRPKAVVRRAVVDVILGRSRGCLGPAELAKKLIPEEYRRNKAAARKKIEEAQKQATFDPAAVRARSMEKVGILETIIQFYLRDRS